MSSIKRISTGYVPRPIQDELHRLVRRFNVLVCHRRFGKTVWAINHMIDAGLRNPLSDPRYAYMAPLYGQVKRVAWDYLKKYTQEIPGSQPNEADLRVDIPRPWKKDSVRISLLGADNPDSLKGIYLDGAALDEYAQMHPSVWREVIRPALSDRHEMDPDQGWGMFIGTPKGKNAFYELYQFANERAREGDPEWFTALYKASQTGIISASELEKLKREMTEEEFLQEFECSFAAGIVGAYYAKLMMIAEAEKRITRVPYDPALTVSAAWDLGIGDTTAIWFCQQLGKEVRIINYREEAGLGLNDWAKKLKELPYPFEEFILPHDAKARELSTGRTREETLRQLFPGVKLKVLPRLPVDDGINAVRMLLPKCYFDGTHCARGLKSLTEYEKAWDAKLQVFRNEPLHNKASHGADAFRYLALGIRRNPTQDRSTLPRQAEMNYDVFNPYQSMEHYR